MAASNHGRRISNFGSTI